MPLILLDANILGGLEDRRIRICTGKRDKVKEMMIGGFESSMTIFDFAAA